MPWLSGMAPTISIDDAKPATRLCQAQSAQLAPSAQLTQAAPSKSDKAQLHVPCCLAHDFHVVCFPCRGSTARPADYT